jgi:hypothetical protein
MLHTGASIEYGLRIGAAGILKVGGIFVHKDDIGDY